MTTEADWAKSAAQRLLKDFGSAGAIETANYQLCGFILAAASLAVADPEVAARIGTLMEKDRST